MSHCSLRLSIQILTGTERTNWLNPYLVGGLLSLTSKIPSDITFVLDQRPHEFARNWACDNALKGSATWVLMVDNDNYISTDFAELVQQADQSPDINIVCGVSWMLKQSCLMTNIWRDENSLPEKPGIADQPGFQKIDQGGSGVLLIRRTVLETVSRPWFHMPLDSLSGAPLSGEDLFFCGKAWAAGFTVHTHAGFPVGHLRTVDLKAVAEHVAGKRGDLAIDLRPSARSREAAA